MLIFGAGISGPILAYRLHRCGWDVTVVEKASGVRSGGCPIDVRGTALEVLERMGLLPQARAAHIRSRRLTIVDAKGKIVGAIELDDRPGDRQGRDVELPVAI